MAKIPSSEDPSKNSLAALLKGSPENHYNFVENVKDVKVPSGSMLLDAQVSVSTGSVVRLAGPTESGKTSQAFLYAKNFMAMVPGSKTLYVKAEGRLSEAMKVRTAMNFVFKPEDWNDGTVFVLESNIFEFVATVIENQLKIMKDQGKQLCVIVDSMDGLMLKNDFHEKEIGENQKVAGVPLITKIFFKRLSLPIAKFGALVFITSQVSANIKLDPYSKEAPRVIGGAGGNSLNHQSDFILEYQPRYGGDWILEDEKLKPDLEKNKILGTWCKIKILKSSQESSGNTVTIPIRRGRIGNAIWQEKEIADFFVQSGLITKRGAWFTVDDCIVKQVKELTGKDFSPQIQGMHNVYAYFEENKDVTAALVKFYSNC